ncbi:MAG: cation-translocating P-type ATPase, partial [Proteobacteria bacterium]|nr:cation-translocating P-type ATPase [Pseudomonadota bacterium]
RDWHALTEEELLEELDVDPGKGLSEAEVKDRLAFHGPNELQVEKPPSPFRIFLSQFKNVLIIILLLAALFSLLAGESFDAQLILLIVLLSAGLGFLQEYKAERAIESLKKMLSPTSRVLRDGSEASVPSRTLVPGDILLLEAGDRVPADARLVKATALKTDEASLTGESLPVEKGVAVLEGGTDLADRKNMLFSGTAVTYGTGRAVVVSTGMNTELGEIAREVGRIADEQTPLERRTAEIGRWFGAAALIICFLVAGTGILRESMAGTLTMEFAMSMLLFAVALAVAAVPEALAGIVTGTLALGMSEMARRKAIVRRMPAVETLGSVTVICSDKTGTITKGEMTIERIHVQGREVTVSGVGYEPVGDFDPQEDPGSLTPLIRAGVLCNDSKLIQEEGQWKIVGDPTEGAFLVLAGKAGLDFEKMRQENPRVGAVPFSSERKLMTTVHDLEGGGRAAFMKGAPEKVLEKCSSEMAGEGNRPLAAGRREEILQKAEEMAKNGLRVLALAGRGGIEGFHEENPEEVEQDMAFIGLAGMMDPPREEAAQAVKVCRDVHIIPVMITGDHKLTAIAVAEKVGIYREGDLALTGAELNDLTDEEFHETVERVRVFARVSPMDKLRIIRAWKDHGQIVAMTGDGVNDAPALKNADIGVAMGITGTEVTKEAADMILADDNFATIIGAVEKGRWIYDNIKKYLTYLLRANLIEIVLLGGIVIFMGGEYMPLLPSTILFVNLITDGLPAIALGIAPADPDIMKRPPRDPKESVFSGEVKIFLLTSLVTIAPVFFWVFLQEKGDILQARTDLFFLFVIIELVMALNFRSLRYSLFRLPPHGWLVGSVVLSCAITFLALGIPSVKESFGVTGPDLKGMLIVLAVTIWVTFSTELTKVFIRRKISLTPIPGESA